MAFLLLCAALAFGVLGFVVRRAGHALEADFINGGAVVLLVLAAFAFLSSSGRPPRVGKPREPDDIGPIDIAVAEDG